MPAWSWPAPWPRAPRPRSSPATSPRRGLEFERGRRSVLTPAVSTACAKAWRRHRQGQGLAGDLRQEQDALQAGQSDELAPEAEVRALSETLAPKACRFVSFPRSSTTHSPKGRRDQAFGALAAWLSETEFEYRRLRGGGRNEMDLDISIDNKDKGEDSGLRSIDTQGGAELTSKFMEIVKDEKICHAVFVLREVPSVTSAGIGKLLSFFKQLRQEGRDHEDRGRLRFPAQAVLGDPPGSDHPDFLSPKAWR